MNIFELSYRLSYLGEGKPGDLFEPTGEGIGELQWLGELQMEGAEGAALQYIQAVLYLKDIAWPSSCLNIFSLLLSISSVCKLKPRIEENVT